MSIAVSAIPTPYIHVAVKRRKTTWYSIADGNWTSRNTWMSNASRRYDYPGQNIPVPVFPQVGDDVYINHAVTVNVVNLIVNNIYVSGSLLFDSTARVFKINGDLQATGTVNLSNAAHNLFLYGVNNFVVNFIGGASSTVIYARTGDQPVMSIGYMNLTITGTGTKYLLANTTLSGALLVNTALGTTLELGIYDFTVTGVTTIIIGNTIKKSGTGNILFIGAFNSTGGINFSGNPNVEMRGGGTWNGFGLSFVSGSGTWNFTTNNQTLSNANIPLVFNGAITVTGAISLTTAGSLTVPFIDGTVAGSTVINAAALYFSTSTNAMATAGVFDRSTYSTNVVGYIFNGNYTLQYTTYAGLYIAGTGTKTLAGNTTLGYTLGGNTNGTLELSTFDFTVGGSSASVKLFKSGGGSVLFIGNLAIGNLDFSGGNPTVECRGGLGYIIPAWNCGTGLWTLSTNNQTITGAIGGSLLSLGNILISGAITVTATNVNVTISGTLNGDNAASTFDNRLTSALSYKNSQQPMLTGVLQCNAAANVWKYNLSGNQDVDGGTYRTIEFGGSGNKTLQGNVIINVTAGGSQSTTGTAVVVLNGFTITTI